MLTDPVEAEAVLAPASGAGVDASTARPVPERAVSAGADAPPETRAAAADGSAPLDRLVRIRVPVIVQLAARTMPIGKVRSLSNGSIIEFDKSVDQPLELLVHKRLIGRGRCVKVGENFGLRIGAICDRAGRIRALSG
jgi:flagellar motor switch protein FliN/FliY